MKKIDYSRYYTGAPVVDSAIQSLEAGANSVPWVARQRRNDYNRMLPEVINAALQRQKEQDDLQRMQEIKNYADSLLQEGKKETVGQVNPNFPSLNPEYIPPMDGQPMPQRRNVGLSMQEAEAILKAAFGGSNASYGLNQLSQVESNKYGEASGEKQSPLVGAISQNQSQPIYFPYADQMITSGASVINNARQYGESNKQFTQEFPGKDAKNKAEAAYLNSQRGVQNAKLAEQLITNQNLPKSIAADNEVKTKQAKKIDAEIANLANKSNEDNQKAYGAAAGEYSGAVDYLKGLGGITPTGVPDMGKINADPDMKKAFKEMQNAKAKMKQLERFRVEKPKETPGSKTLEMTAPQGQRGLKLPSGKML